MPHGHCYFWRPAVLWTNVLGDGLIALSYYAIPFLLFRFVKERPDIKFRAIFAAFALFITACGTTHVLDIISVWNPVYRLEGVVKVLTGLISFGTFILLYKLFPQILTIPTNAQLATTNAKFLSEIEQRKQSEEKLRQSEERFRLVMQKAPIGKAITDKKGRFIEINDALAKLLGYSKEELLKLSFRDITHPDDLPETHRNLDALENGDADSYQIEKRYIKADGSVVWCFVSVAPLEGTDLYIGQLIDFTDVKEVERKNRELNRMLEKKVEERTAALVESKEDMENFIYAITHDLRVPLQNLDGLSNMVQEELSEMEINSETKAALNMIGENARKMDELIKDLLHFSRAGRTEFIKESINMAELFKLTFDEARTGYFHKDIKFKLNDLPPAFGDHSAIRQVCQNLLSNAVKYSSQNDKINIEVSGWLKDGNAVYCIRDNGVGFDERYKKKLFNLFQRLHDGNEFEGTGVGLATSYRLVKKHGGEMWAEGKVGEGAAFYFSLPN